MFFIFAGLEKAFDWVPRQKGVPAYLIDGFMSTVLVDGKLLSSFSVKSSVHQVMLMEVLTKELRDGSLMEFLSPDSLVLCGESSNEVMEKFVRWYNSVETKSLRVNVDKTKGRQLLFWKECSVSKVDLCVSEMSGLVVILFSVRNVRDGFIVVVMVCLGR